MNTKADKFKKSKMKQMAMQTEENVATVQQGQRILMGLAQKMYELDVALHSTKARLEKAEAMARYADYRSTALSNLLQAAGNFSEEVLLNEIELLQVKDFDYNSKVDDERSGLEDAGQGPAANGMHAIFVMKIFKGGKELLSERVVRAKSELGNEKDAKNMLPGVHDALVGMNVGESKRMPMDLQGQTDEAEITLLGLRKPVPQAETPENQSSEQA